MRILIGLLILSSTTAFSMTSCKDLSRIQSEIYISALNISNANTTRTVDGGPFKKRKVGECTPESCKILKLDNEESFILVYDPNHPDANETGYVKKPYIDKKDELANFQANIAYLRSIGELKKCGLEVSDYGDSILVKYPFRQSAKLDVINLNASVVRTWRNGKKEIINL